MGTQQIIFLPLVPHTESRRTMMETKNLPYVFLISPPSHRNGAWLALGAALAYLKQRVSTVCGAPDSLLGRQGAERGPVIG